MADPMRLVGLARRHARRVLLLLGGLVMLALCFITPEGEDALAAANRVMVAVPSAVFLILKAFLPRRPTEEAERLARLHPRSSSSDFGDASTHEPPFGERGREGSIPTSSLHPELFPTAPEFFEDEARRASVLREVMRLGLGVLLTLAILAVAFLPVLLFSHLAAPKPLGVVHIAFLAAAGAVWPLFVLYRRLFR